MIGSGTRQESCGRLTRGSIMATCFGADPVRRGLQSRRGHVEAWLPRKSSRTSQLDAAPKCLLVGWATTAAS